MLLNLSRPEVKTLKKVIRFYIKTKGMQVSNKNLHDILNKIDTINVMITEIDNRYNEYYPPVKCSYCGVKKHRDLPCSNCSN